jgi:hypothetical protein
MKFGIKKSNEMISHSRVGNFEGMSHILLGLFCLENKNICHQPSLATLTKQLQLNPTTTVMKGSCGTSDKKMPQIGPEPQN